MIEDRTPPKVENAPGLVWRPRKKNEWAATWQARLDLVNRGYRPRTVPLWRGTELSDVDIGMIQEQCQRLQGDMLLWGRGGPTLPSMFDGTIHGLARAYQTDPDSKFPKLQYKTREYYCILMKRIIDDHGHERLSDVNARLLLRWHAAWTERGVAAAHAYVGMLRTLIGFGMTFLENDDCERLCAVMHKMRFKMAKPRNERLTAEQAEAVRKMAHTLGLHSIGLAQAFQFECMLRQKDVIGEWVPVSEPGLSDTIGRGEKWLKGLRWEEIDKDLILRHTTSKRQKDIEIDLKHAPMVMEELTRMGELPTSGPIIISEYTSHPYKAHNFRRVWRQVADEAGIPKAVKNMDSRAGAITEASEAGADLEHIKHAATHGDISMTQRYSRGATEKIARVQQARIEHRKKNGER